MQEENDIRLGSPPVDNVTIDIEGERTLFRLAGLSAILGLGISMLCLRSVRLTAFVFWISIPAAGAGLALVYFTGGTCDAILLFAALFGDLVFLPAMLTSPLGRFFDHGRKRRRPTPVDELATGEDPGDRQVVPIQHGELTNRRDRKHRPHKAS